MTIVALMAILGIVAFQNYGKGSIFQQVSSEVESTVNQVGLLARNPENDAKSYCLLIANDKLTLYKGLDVECNTRTIVREVTLPSGDNIIDKTDENSSRFLRCEILADDCFVKQSDNSVSALKVIGKKFLFRLSNGGSGHKDYFVKTNPFLIEVE